VYCRIEWRADGARRAATRGDAIVVVDTLSFSTGVSAAANAGAIVYPTADKAGASLFAGLIGAELAVRRKEVPDRGRFSLSPATLQHAEHGAKILLPSPNGARCSLAAQGSPIVCAGAIVNASAVAEFVQRWSTDSECDISLIACGEAQDPYNPQTTIRFALEDLLGVGAVARGLECGKSPEIRAAEAAFERAMPNLCNELLACESGRELIEMGYPQDVEFAARMDAYAIVGVFDGQKYVSSVNSKI
jgi:2-phosphosulfolactate phosphatase